MEEIKIKTLDQLPQAAEKFAALMGDNKIFAFRGDMGVGKTTFIRELVRRLGVEEDTAVNSPSFSLINEYRSSSTGALIYHFDLYRLESIEEALDIGIEDYLDSGVICLIEWPDIIDPLLPYETVDVKIEEEPDGARTIKISTDFDS